MGKYRLAEYVNGKLSAFRTVYYSKAAAYNANAMIHGGKYIVVEYKNGKLIK